MYVILTPLVQSFFCLLQMTDSRSLLYETDKVEWLNAAMLVQKTDVLSKGQTVVGITLYNEDTDIVSLQENLCDLPHFKAKTDHTFVNLKLMRLLFQKKGQFNPHNYNSVIMKLSSKEIYVFVNESRRGHKSKFSIYLSCFKLLDKFHDKYPACLLVE